MNESTYVLAKAVCSAVFMSLMNAYNCRDNEWDSNRHFKHADFLEAKFKSQFGHHPQSYIDLYEQTRSESDA